MSIKKSSIGVSMLKDKSLNDQPIIQSGAKIVLNKTISISIRSCSFLMMFSSLFAYSLSFPRITSLQFLVKRKVQMSRQVQISNFMIAKILKVKWSRQIVDLQVQIT